MRSAGAETVEGTAVRGAGAGRLGPSKGAETVEGPRARPKTSPTASSSAPRSSSLPLLHRLASCCVGPLRSLPGTAYAESVLATPRSSVVIPYIWLSKMEVSSTKSRVFL